MRREHGIRTERSQYECQWRWPSYLPIALAFICCAHLSTFSEPRVRRGRKGTSQASAACSAHFEIQLTCAALSRGGYLAVSFLPRLSFTLASENANKCAQQTRLTQSASMRANATGIHTRYAPCVSCVCASNFPPSSSAQS